MCGGGNVCFLMGTQELPPSSSSICDPPAQGYKGPLGVSAADSFCQRRLTATFERWPSWPCTHLLSCRRERDCTALLDYVHLWRWLHCSDGMGSMQELHWAAGGRESPPGRSYTLLSPTGFHVINGGSHAGNKLAMQEFMILPVGAETPGGHAHRSRGLPQPKERHQGEIREGRHQCGR